jgi:hypothetical protein
MPTNDYSNSQKIARLRQEKSAIFLNKVRISYDISSRLDVTLGRQYQKIKRYGFITPSKT